MFIPFPFLSLIIIIIIIIIITFLLLLWLLLFSFFFFFIFFFHLLLLLHLILILLLLLLFFFFFFLFVFFIFFFFSSSSSSSSSSSPSSTASSSFLILNLFLSFLIIFLSFLPLCKWPFLLIILTLIIANYYLNAGKMNPNFECHNNSCNYLRIESRIQEIWENVSKKRHNLWCLLFTTSQFCFAIMHDLFNNQLFHHTLISIISP